MFRVLLVTFKPVNNLICCKTGLMWVVKSATSLFNLFCSNVARQVVCFLLPVFTHLKFGSCQEKFDVWSRPKSYNALVIFGVPFE